MKAAIATVSLFILCAASFPRVVIPPTNRVSRIPFAWNRYVMPNALMFLKYGSEPGQYTNQINVTGLTNYTLLKTNWTERAIRHYFVLEVPNVGRSTEIFWPLYSPDRMDITSSAPVMLQFSLTLSNWFDLAPAPVTVLFNQPHLFFRGSGNRATLSVRAYNPRNEQ